MFQSSTGSCFSSPLATLCCCIITILIYHVKLGLKRFQATSFRGAKDPLFLLCFLGLSPKNNWARTCFKLHLLQGQKAHCFCSVFYYYYSYVSFASILTPWTCSKMTKFVTQVRIVGKKKCNYDSVRCSIAPPMGKKTMSTREKSLWPLWTEWEQTPRVCFHPWHKIHNFSLFVYAKNLTIFKTVLLKKKTFLAWHTLYNVVKSLKIKYSIWNFIEYFHTVCIHKWQLLLSLVSKREELESQKNTDMYFLSQSTI